MFNADRFRSAPLFFHYIYFLENVLLFHFELFFLRKFSFKLTYLLFQRQTFAVVLFKLLSFECKHTNGVILWNCLHLSWQVWEWIILCNLCLLFFILLLFLSSAHLAAFASFFSFLFRTFWPWSRLRKLGILLKLRFAKILLNLYVVALRERFKELVISVRSCVLQLLLFYNCWLKILTWIITPILKFILCLLLYLEAASCF